MFDPFTFATLGSIMYGTSLAVLSFTNFALQREFLRGDNKNIAVSVGLLQGVMSSVLMTTLYLAFPVLSSLRVVSFISWGLFFLPITASLCAGGYAKFKESWFSTNYPLLKSLLNNTDAMLAKIPAPISAFMSHFLSKLHPWLGSVFFAAQMAVFSVMIPVQPIVGIAGLSYFGMYYARGKNLLPAVVAKPMEKFNYWVNLLSGIFLNNTILKVTAFLSICREFTINVAFPRFLKSYMGKNSEFLQVADLTEVQKPAPQISRGITTQNFRALLSILPDLANDNARNVSGGRGRRKADLEVLFAEVGEIFGTYDFRDSYAEVARSMMLREQVEKIEQVYQNVPRLSGPGLSARLRYYASVIKYYPSMAAAGIRLTYLSSKAMFVTANSFLDKMERQGPGLAVTVRHMADARPTIPLAPKVDLKDFKQLVEASSLEHSVGSFKVNCLASPKFQRIDLTLHDRLIELNEEQRTRVAGSIEKKIVSNNAAKTEINSKLLEAWRSQLSLPKDATETVIFITYIQTRLDDIYERIATGRDMLWDKKTQSFEEFQQMGWHLLAHCRDLLQAGEEKRIEAHDILARLAIEAGDFCANGVYDVVKDQFARHVLPKFSKNNKDMTAQQELALYLQQQRQDLFDAIYFYCKDHPQAKALFPTIDFDDRHTYSLITSLFRVLNLKSKFNAQSDLSNNQLGFLTQMQYNMYVYFAARLMMLLEQAYSPKGILSRMSHENMDGGESTFNAGACCAKWAEDFDPAIAEYVKDLLAAYGTDEKTTIIADKGRIRLYTMMLYDVGVLKTSNPALAEQIAKVLENPSQDVDFNFDTADFELSEEEPAILPASQPPFVPGYAFLKQTVSNIIDSTVASSQAPHSQSGNRCSVM